MLVNTLKNHQYNEDKAFVNNGYMFLHWVDKKFICYL